MMMNYVFWTLLKFEYSGLSAFSWKLISNNECDRRDTEGGPTQEDSEREMAMIAFIMIFVIMGGAHHFPAFIINYIFIIHDPPIIHFTRKFSKIKLD